MPERVCRLQWRKGLPLSLAISPKVCFLDLPQELLNNIYYYGLVAPEPIIVWSGTYRVQERWDNLGNPTRKSWETVDTNTTVPGDLALGLLSCSQQISRDAAATLYRRNTFCFMGENNWSPLYAFLVMIGRENRRNLRSLEMHMPKPTKVIQHADGTRTFLDDWRFCEVIPFNRHLLYHSTPDSEGRVDHLDPAIEACFRILGKGRPALTLVLRLDRHFLPGVNTLIGPHHPNDHYFSMDVPIMMEKLKQDLTASSDGNSQVEVLWKGECSRDRYADRTRLIRGNGWVIVDTEEGHYDRGAMSANRIALTTLFTLRRIEWPFAPFPAD